MRYAITYETWIAESIEAGETDDKGYDTEWTSCNWGDIWDLKSDWASSQDNGNDTFTNFEEMDFRTGETTNRTLHFKDVDCLIVADIFNGKIRRESLSWATSLKEVRDCAKAFDDSEVIERLEELLEEAENELASGFLVPCYSLTEEMELEDKLSR